MRDLAFIGFLCAIFALGFRRPFIFILAYGYVDIVAPQRLTYYLLNSIPVSQLAVGLAVMSWALIEDKRNVRVAPRQGLLLLLLLYCGLTMLGSEFPEDAAHKWGWVWKALAFSIFLPLTLHTRLRIEAFMLYMILCAASIIIVGGIKTLLSGGGYGTLALLVDNNSGLYEGSIISTVAISLIPMILFITRYGTIFPSDWRVRSFGYALCFSCLLLPIGTEARTGLVCIGVLVLLMLRQTQRRALYIGLIGIAGLIAIPLLPSSFTQRMDTIQGYKADSSASTRIAVWKWTWDYVKEHPFGGGFDAYRANRISFETVATTETGAVATVERIKQVDQARAYHSSYFEMLGEQGYPGFALWMTIQLIGLWRMEILQRRYKLSGGEDWRWIAPLAGALQNTQIIYLVGSLFLGIAFQPFLLMIISVQIGFDTYVTRRSRESGLDRGSWSVPIAKQKLV